MLARFLALALISAASLGAEVRSLTILHVNDLHARLTPLQNGNGGFAYLAAAIRRERANCNDCILLNAGDVAQGSPVSTIFHGLPVFEIANLLGFDAATLGNHDFDYGWIQTRKFIQIARYPIVTSNIVDAKGGLFTPHPYVILNVNGLRVAIIGCMTGTLKALTFHQLLGEWHTLPPLETARRLARELRPKSDLIVALGHLTGEEETEFLEKAPEIAVIVTGHIHAGMERTASKDGRILVRVKGYGEELGRLELKVDIAKKSPASWIWKRIPIDARRIEPDAEVARQVNRWESEVTTRIDQPLAKSGRLFNKVEVKHLIEQAMRDETGADFSFMNQGGVRDVLPQGQLLVRHIWNIMPFDNLVLVGTFKGRDLPSVVVGDRKIDPDRDYTLAVTDFSAENQSSKENLRTTGLQFPHDVGLLRDLLVDWFRKKKVIEN